ncbi:MAG: tetratricopeptide repeat protein [Bacillota bacterium]
MTNETELNVAANRQEGAVPLGRALTILAVVLGVVIVVGLIIGYAFFWGKYQRQTFDDVVMEAAQHRVKENPNDAIAHLELGYAYLLRQETKKAMAEYNKAYKIDPKNRQVRYNLALGHTASKQYEEAIKLLQPLAKEGVFDFDSHYSLGEAYYLNGQYPEAVKAYAEAGTIKPGYANTFYAMALCYENMGDKKNALASADRALRLVPNYKEVLDFKARLNGEQAGGEKRE